MLGRDALHGQRDDALGLALGIPPRRLADLAHAIGRVGACLLLDAVDELALGILGRETGERLEPVLDLAAHAVELLVTIGDLLLAAADLAAAARELLVPLFQRLGAAIEAELALLHAALLSLQLVAAAADLLLPALAELDQLLLAREHGGLAQRLGFALGLTDEPPGSLLGAGVGGLEASQLATAADARAHHVAERASGQQQHAERDENLDCWHRIYGRAPPLRPAPLAGADCGEAPARVNGALATALAGGCGGRSIERPKLR